MRYFILLSIISSATYSYSSKYIRVNKASYVRYIKPQVKNIFNDYEKILTLFNSDLSPIAKQLKSITKLESIRVELEESCSLQVSLSCHKTIRELYTVLPPLSKNISYKQNIKVSSFAPKLNTQRRELIKLIEKLNYKLGIYQTGEKPGVMVVKIKQQLKKIVNHYHFLVLAHLPTKIQNEFNLLWREFYLPLEKEILIKDNYQYFKSELKSLNSAWNSFNVVMTKRGVKLPQGVESRLEIIHRRWRSILKLILKQ